MIPSMIEGIRSRLDYGVSWNKQWSWGYVRPEIQLKHLAYKLKNYDISSIGNNDESPNITVPIYSFDTGIFLERDSELGSALLQTFEPRIFYLNSSSKINQNYQILIPENLFRPTTHSFKIIALWEEIEFLMTRN
jgi:hypothetical protein